MALRRPHDRSYGPKAPDGEVRKYWTTLEVRLLRAIYPNTSNPEIGRRLGRTDSAVMIMALKLGLRKSPAFMASAAVRWQRGNRPWNAGRKGWQAGGRARLTKFKKGHRGARQKPVGSVRRERDGMMIKVAEPRLWVPLARYVWEQNFGKISAGGIVRLKDRNPENCAPENLQLVTRAEHVRLNWKPRGPVRKPICWTAPLRMAA